jgi:hypothetical protein
MSRQLFNVSPSALPLYNRDSKMTQYDLLYDPKINAVRAGFYQSKFKGYVPTNNDQYYTVELKLEHRTDLISLKFYGSSVYDWVIEDANNISDPIQQIVAGAKLIIPDKTAVYST